ncbi:uncharacterized protein LOC120200754 [Hibiscus syriacus]|uniref:uncharacterized protein LOC120200754 n=1 Tax=Hibiscus syriacus TaxID=106335 RepID=UPI001922D7AB|nr:uncharacterized protein LOC120200754 [Hibiscus syriacus]
MDQTSVRRRRSWLPTRFFSALQRRRQKPQKEHLHGESHFRRGLGGATAECAAICCCCPLTIANFLVLAIYKIPAGLFRRALHRIRQRKLPEKGLNQRSHDGFHNEGFEIPAVDGVEEIFGCVETEKAANELEKEMWQKFWDWILEKSFSSPRIE